MNTQSIFEQGGMFIPNPKYNPKSKKNTEPAYIHTTNVGENDTNSMADAFKRNLDNTWVMGDTTSYQRYGVTPNKINDMDTERADHQSALAKFGNALAQTVVSEVGIGTVLGFTDLADFVGSRILGVMDKDYQNPVSNYLEKLQDKFNNEVAPIYATPGVDISNGGIFNAGWWASNIPSIASSLTLLLPAAATTKGLSMLAKLGTKGANIASGTRATVRALSKALPNKAMGRWMNKRSVIDRANLFVKNGITAALSRTMENYQEGRQVYNDMYAEASEKLKNMSDEDYANFVNNNPETLKDVDTSNRDEVAKKIAKESADTDFYGNYVNTVSDIIELYALRNAFGSGRLSDIGRTSVRKAQRLSLRYPGKTAAEIEVLEKARPTTEKLKDKIGDALFGSKLAIFAQLNEGAEEAVNYVMQEEGMHTGRTILGTDMKTSFWDDRLKSYMRSPQLWESAFWGVLGGVVFQAGGSYLNRVQQTIDDNKKAKHKTNQETGEETPDVGWRGLSELPEVQRRVKDIEARAQRAQDVADKLKLIEQGKNPFNPEQELTDEVEKESAKRLIRKQAIVDTTMNAINNGNFDLTKEYFQSDDVRKAMVEKGVVSEEESHKWQQDVLNDMDKIKEQYETEIEHLDNLSSDYKDKIPMEFLQIAATDNVYNRLNVETLTEQQNDYKEAYNKAKEAAQKDGKINPNLDYERNLELEMQVNTLYALYKERREIEEKQKKEKTLVGQIALDNINKNIKTQQKKLYENAANKNVSDTLFALGNIYSENKSHGEIDSQIESLIDEATNKGTFRGFEEFLGLNKNSVSNITDAEELKKFKKEYLDRGKGYKEAMKEINKLGEDVPNLYRSAIQTQFLIDKANNAIVTTKDEFAQYMTNANNTLSEMRRNAINTAYDDISSVAQEVGVDTIKDYLKQAVDTGKIDNNLIKDLSDENKTKLSNAVKVLNFSNVHNKPLYTNIAALLDVINFNENEKKSNISESSETEQTSSSNNQSQTTNEMPTEQANNQSGNLQQQERQPQNHKISLKDDGNGKRSINLDDENGDINLLLSDPESNSYTMDIANSPYANDPSVLSNKNLFEVTDGASVMDDNAKIIENPMVILGGNNSILHVQKGRIGKINDENAGEETAPATQQNPETSTSAPVEDVANTKLEEAGVTINPTTNNNNQTPVDDQASQTPFTGGQEQSSNTNATPTTNPAVNPDEEAPVIDNKSSNAESDITKMDEIERNIKLVMGKRINAANYTEFNGQLARADALKYLTDNNLSPNIVIPIIDKILNQVRAMNLMLKSMRNPSEQTSRYLEHVDGNNMDEAFSKVFKSFVDEYTKANLLPKFDGKYNIYLSDILRLCTEKYANKEEVAREFYEQIRDYLLSDEGKENYTVIDEDEINESVAINNATSNSNNINNINNGEENVYSARVDIIDIHNQDRSLEQDELYRQAMAAIQTGDDVELTINPADSSRIYIDYTFNSNGKSETKTIGYMAIPTLVGNSYTMLNEYWYTDVNSEGKGKVFEVFKDIFTNQAKEYEELRAILIDSFKFRNTSMPNNLINRFKTNKVIEKCINDRIIRLSKDTKYHSYELERALKHVSKLYNYNNRITATNNIDEKINATEQTINNYAKTLYDSYDAIAQIKDNTTVKVSHINEGQIIRVVNDGTVDAYDKLNYVQQGVQDLGSIKIGIVNPNKPSMMSISTQDEESARHWQSGSTVIAVYSRNTRPDFVKAIGVKATEVLGNNKDNVPNAIVKEAKKQIATLIDQLRKDVDNRVDTKDTFDKLKDILNSLFASTYGSDYNSLFRGFGDYSIAIKDNVRNNSVNGIEISIYRKGTTTPVGALTICNKGNFGNTLAVKTSKDNTLIHYAKTEEDRNTSKVFADKVLNEIDNILSYCGINMSALGIENDNRPSIPMRGFFERKNGKLNIPIINQTYNSYNDFIINNNLIKVNTQVNAFGSNFEMRGSNQNANQQLFVDLPITKRNTTNNATTDNTENTDKEYNRIKSTLEGKVNTGEDVVRAVFGDEAIDKLKEDAKDVYNELLPERVIVDERINDYTDSKGEKHERKTVAIHSDEGAYSLANNHTTGHTEADTVIIGKILLKAAASGNSMERNLLISKLIHEQIHSKLMNMPNKTELLNEIKGIYEEFRSIFNPRYNELVKKYNEHTLTEDEKVEYSNYKHINDLFVALPHNNGKTLLYEEFLAESLTNRILFNMLNSIQTNTNDNVEKETFFDKVVKFIAKLFGFNVNDDSLLKKELKVINNFINKPDDNNNSNINNEINKEETQITSEETDGWNTSSMEEYEETDGWNTSSMEEELSSSLEPIANVSNVIRTTSTNKFVSSLPLSVQQDVKNLINDGYINMTCSI